MIVLGSLVILLNLCTLFLHLSSGNTARIPNSVYGILLGAACIIGGILRKKRKQKQQERLGVEGEDI